MRHLSPVIILSLLASGCAVGPNYQRPASVANDAPWLAPVAAGEVRADWWAALGDPVLDGLVRDALAANLDIAEAQARLREARAGRDVARARTVPEVRATGFGTEQQVSKNGQIPIARIPGFERDFSLFDLGFDASWEIDFWGAVKRGQAAAGARSVAAGLRADDVRLQVIAETVRAYADLRAAQARGELLQREADVRRELAGLMALRSKAGESSRSDAALAQQRAETAAAAVPEAGASAKAALYRLAVLTAKPPEALVLADGTVPEAPDLVAVGVRSELLQRRPDVRAAEADLIAATADIGVETANLYPRFSLTGGIGQQAKAVGDLVNGDSTRFSVGPSFSWPIFSFGRIKAQIRAADARRDGALARFERAVLSALADSETAANRYGAALVARGSRSAALTSAQTAARLADQRFKRGEDDRMQMLEARSNAIAAEQALVAARADALGGFVSFAKSLAGGAMR